MERVAHKSRSPREAQAWEIAQYQRMTPAQRVYAARLLKERAYPPPRPDVRECYRRNKRATARPRDLDDLEHLPAKKRPAARRRKV